MLMGTAFTLKVGICWFHKLNRENSSTPIYAVSTPISCLRTVHTTKSFTKVNMLPMYAIIPSRNKINFITT